MLIAVNVAQNHIKNPKVPEDEASPYILVTVLVDRVDFTDYVVKVSKIVLFLHLALPLKPLVTQ